MVLSKVHPTSLDTERPVWSTTRSGRVSPTTMVRCEGEMLMDVAGTTLVRRMPTDALLPARSLAWRTMGFRPGFKGTSHETAPSCPTWTGIPLQVDSPHAGAVIGDGPRERHRHIGRGLGIRGRRQAHERRGPVDAHGHRRRRRVPHAVDPDALHDTRAFDRDLRWLRAGLHTRNVLASKRHRHRGVRSSRPRWAMAGQTS